jgi:hypothetical protein
VENKENPISLWAGPLQINLAFTVTKMLLDVNEMRTYKNGTATQEVPMLTFVKDLLAFVTICGFSVASLTWMDIAARLV